MPVNTAYLRTEPQFSQTSFPQTIAGFGTPAARSATTTFRFNGVRVGDQILAAPPSSGLSDGLAYSAFVTSDNTVTLNFSNCSASRVTQGAATWTFYRLAASR